MRYRVLSLRARIVLALAPVFVAGLAISDVVTYTSLNSFLISRVDQQLQSGHPAVESALAGSGYGPPGGGDNGGGGLPLGTVGEVVAKDGTILDMVTLSPMGSNTTSSTNGARPVLPSGLATAGDAETYFTAASTSGSTKYRVFSEPMALRDGTAASLVVAIPLDDISATLGQLVLLESVVSGSVVIVIFVATFVLVRRGLRPLETMGTTARSIAASDLSRRIEPATERTEVGRLGIALNIMLSKLEENFDEISANEQRLRHFLSDASHELRTPLTSMRGYAELLRRNPSMESEDVATAVRRMEAETQRMSVLVDDLMLLARLDQGRPLTLTDVDLGTLVADVCSDARAAAPDREITMSGAAASVRADPMRLQQAVGNLVRNAVVHTPPTTAIEVSVKDAGDAATIEVVDHGPGIPPGHAEQIFRRFHRADPERSGDQGGSGLGLSIVAAIVAAHHAAVDVVETPGGGATFRITIPRPASPTAD